jgi:hypothetical protein
MDKAIRLILENQGVILATLIELRENTHIRSNDPHAEQLHELLERALTRQAMKIRDFIGEPEPGEVDISNG